MAEKQYAAAGGVVIHNGRMLLLDRPSRNEVRLPKGHIEQGESPLAAAQRETAEESGYADLIMVADLGSQIVEFTLRDDHVTRSEHYFLFGLNSDERVERSVQDEAQFHPVWVPLDEVTSRLTYAAEQEMARRAIAALAP